MRALRYLLWLIDHPAAGVYASPVLLGVGFFYAVTGPGWWQDFFLDHAAGWIISFWLGSGFAYTWWMIRRGAFDLPGGQVTGAIVGIAAIAVITGFGVFTDLYLFGIAIWPGLAMLAPALHRRLESASSTASPVPGDATGG